MASNFVAKALKAMHTSHQPLVLANIWDIASLNAILHLNEGGQTPVRALATASWVFAAVRGIRDEELSLDQNIASISELAPLAARANLPLSVDLQDGYGENIKEAVSRAIQAGAHGANLEDSYPLKQLRHGADSALYSVEDQVTKIRSALQVAKEESCPDFVINARCDVLALHESPELDEATRFDMLIGRGKAYLQAGATTVFVWRQHGTGLGREEVQRLAEAFNGRVAVRLGQTKGALSVAELSELGVQRISVGPSLYQLAMQTIQESALAVLQGGNLPHH